MVEKTPVDNTADQPPARRRFVMSSDDTNRCEVCGRVDGNVPHIDEEIGNLAGVRLDRVREYVREHTEHDDPHLIPWDHLSEAVTHIQQLRNRELGIGYLAQLEDDL